MAIDVSRAHARNQRVKLLCQLAFHVPVWALVLLAMSTLDDAVQRNAAQGRATLVGLAVIGFGLIAAGFGTAAGIVRDTEEAEDLHRERRALLLGAGALVSSGASLILLSFAGPGGLVPAALGLWSVLILNALATVLVAIRARRLDELNRSVERDAGHLAFTWFSWVGGTWAIVAYLGYAAAPTLLDWLTMLHGFSFVAGLVAFARRGGFEALPGGTPPAR